MNGLESFVGVDKGCAFGSLKKVESLAVKTR